MILALALVSMTAAADSAERWELKGLRLGSALSEFAEHFPDPDPPKYTSSFSPCREDNTAAGLAVCYERGHTIAGVYADAMVYYFDGEAVRIAMDFPASRFSTIADALRAKFGEPQTESRETVKNRMGAEFDNHVLEWNHSNGDALRIEELHASIDRGAVILQSAGFDQEWERRRKAAALDKASEL